MAWNDLSMRERNAYILTAIRNGIYDRLLIIDTYNRFGDGGSKENISWDETPEGIATNAAIGLVPVVGTLNEGRLFINNPSWELAGWTTLSALGDLATIFTLGAGEGLNAAVSTAKAARSMSKAVDAYKSTKAAVKLAKASRMALSAYEADVIARRGGPSVSRRATMNRRAANDRLLNGPTYFQRSMNTLDNLEKGNLFLNYGSLGVQSGFDLYNKFDFGGDLINVLKSAKSTLKSGYKNAKELVSNIKNTVEEELTMPNIYKTVSGWFEDESPKSVSNFSPINQFNDLDLSSAFSRLNLKYKDESLNLAKSALNNMSKDEIKDILRNLAEQGFYDESLEGKTKQLIKDILRQLVNKGYLNDKKLKNGEYAEVDGVVGNKTITAYNLYNRDKNIDGIVGKKTERGYLLSLGVLGDNVNTVSAKGIDGCALWVTKLFESMYGGRSKLNGVISNAWLMIKNIEEKGGEIIYNIYDSDFNNVRSVPALKSLTEKKLKLNPLDYSLVHLGDIVGIYMPSSNMHETALKDGTTKNTHVGIVTGFNEDGIPIISHNIHESLRDDLITNITGSKSGKARVTSIARPKNATSVTRLLPFTSKDSSVYVEGVEDKNGVLGLYMNSIEGSKEIISLIFPSVNMDFVLRIALGIQLRETGMLQNRTSDLIKRGDSSLINIPKLKDDIRDYARYVKGLDEESKSSDTGKMKLSAFTPSERIMLGIKSPQDLNDPVIAGRAAMYYLSKNADYFIRLRREHPELGLTDNDIAGLTALSYNQGMNKLKHIGFNEDTLEVDMSEIDSIRLMQNPNYRVKDVGSTNWRYLGSLGEWIYNKTSDGSESYMSSALRNSRRIKKKNK